MKNVIADENQAGNQTPVERGYQFILDDDYQRALLLLAPLAEHGCSYACLYMGWIYEEGLGVTQDHQAAERWYRLSAEAQCVEGQHYLATFLLNAKNVDEAVTWYERAAEAGYLRSLYRLSRMYAHGIGVERSKEMAYRYRRDAALKVHIFARRDLALQMIREPSSYTQVVVGVWKWIAAVFDGVCMAFKNVNDERLRC